MPEYEFEMRAVMKALNASGALPHCIVTGSWAMYFYKSIFVDFHPRVETTDLAILMEIAPNRGAFFVEFIR